MELYEEIRVQYFRAIKIENTDKFKDFLKKIQPIEIKDCKCDMKFDYEKDFDKIYVAYDDNGNIDHIHTKGLTGYLDEYLSYHEYKNENDENTRCSYSIRCDNGNIKRVPMVNKFLV